MLRRSTRAATPRSIEDSPVPLTSEDRFVLSIRSNNKNTINSIKKGKQRQLDTVLLSDSSISSASNTSSPAFKGIEIRSEVDSDAEHAPSSNERYVRRSTRTPAPRRSNHSPVPLTSDHNSPDSTQYSTQSSASSTTSRLHLRTRPSTMRGGQRGSRSVNHGSMVSDEGTSSRESSVEFVSASYATQPPPPMNKEIASTGSKKVSSAASIKHEMLSRVTKTSNRLIIPDIRPIIASPTRKSTGQISSTNEQSVDDVNVISGQPDWLPSPSPSQRHQEKDKPSNTSDSFSLPHTASLDLSRSHSAASSAEALAPIQNETQGQASFITARAIESQDHSFALGNTALTQSPSNRPRPKPRPSATTIASSHNSPSKDRPFATQPVARPKPRPVPKPMLTQSHQQLSIGSASSSRDPAEEEDVLVTRPELNRESGDGNQPSTITAESASHLSVEREQSSSESFPSNAMNDDAEVDESVPPSTRQLRSREKKRKRSPSVVIIDDSPSPSPPTKVQVINQAKEQNLPKKGIGRSKKAHLAQVRNNATQVEPPRRGRGRPKKVPGTNSQSATSTKKKPSQPVTRKKPVSLRGKRKTSMLAIMESEELFSTAPPPPRQSPEVPIPVQSSVATPPRRHRRRSPTPDEEEEEEEPAQFIFADERPEPSRSVSNTSLSQFTFRPTQSQRPKPRVRQIDWDDEPETYFATAPDAHASSLNDQDEHVEEQDVRDDTLSDTENTQSGSTFMQDIPESNLESENVLVTSPGSVAEEQEPESSSDADRIENMLDTAMTEIEEHDKDSQSIAPSEGQLSEAVLEQASQRDDTLSDSEHEHSELTVMQNPSESYSRDSNSDEVDSSQVVEPAKGQERARSNTPAPNAHQALYSEEISSSSSPPHSSSPPSSTSSYESALETQRRTQDKDVVQEDTQQKRLLPAQQIEVGQIAQIERSRQLFSIAADGRALRIHVPMAITERDSIVELIRSNGARVCNRIEECDVILVDDELLESENRTVLTVIRDATRPRSQKSIVRRAWLVDSVEVGKALDYSDSKYALSNEQIESAKAKPVARLYNSVPNQSSENLSLLRPPPGIGGRIRVDFTEADATQIIGHLAITKKAWDGTLCARELENRFKRHTWMSYQSHIRDNLKKNKHYGDRAQELQIKMGQEKIILERHKMQKGLYGSGENLL